MADQQEDRTDDAPGPALLAEALAEMPPEMLHGLGRDQAQNLALQIDMALSLRDIAGALVEIAQQNVEIMRLLGGEPADAPSSH